MIHKDDNKTKIGVVSIQNRNPIYFYSCESTPAKMNYKSKETELLIMVGNLKQFHTILLLHHITVYTDHKVSLM